MPHGDEAQDKKLIKTMMNKRMPMANKNAKAGARQDAIKRRMQKNGDKPGGY